MSTLCFGCFKEKNNTGACPDCGYVPGSDAAKYPAALSVGGILKERYIVGRVLGQGGFGITYAALDFATRQRVAIKEFFPAAISGRSSDGSVKPHSGQMEEYFTQGKSGFIEEAHTLEQLKGGRHIVNILDYFEENGTGYFVMDFVQGQNLKAYVKIMGGRLGEEAANRILMPIMEALGEVHARGMVHRDIAPDNIIVTAEGSATLIDFGAARYSTGEKSMSLDVVLKHGYAPVEQYSRRSRQGPFTDVYAMAATYYYAVTGHTPPDAIDRIGTDQVKSPSALGIKLSPHVEAALMKGLAVEAENRFSTMEDFLGALKGAKQPKTKNKQKPEKKKGGKGFVITAVLALCAVAAVFILKPGSAPEKPVDSRPTATPGQSLIGTGVNTPEPENTPESEDGPEGSLMFEPTLLYDAGGVTVTATEYIPYEDWAELVMSVRNTSGKDLWLMDEYFVANDCLSLCNVSLYSKLSAGEQEVSAHIGLDEIREAGISELSTLEIKLSVYDPETYEEEMGEPVVINISNAPIETGNLDDRGVLLYDDRGIKLVYKGISDGNLILYADNKSAYNVSLYHEDARVDGVTVTESDVLYTLGVCRTGTELCSDMHLTKNGERLTVSEDSWIVLDIVLYLYSEDGEYIDRIELSDVEIP